MPFFFQASSRLSAYAILPWDSNSNAVVPPPELTAGPLFAATAVENVCVKFAHWICWYVGFPKPLFGLYAATIRLPSVRKAAGPQGMFQNFSGFDAFPLLPLLLPPGVHAASSVAAATPPAPASRVRRVKPAPLGCEAITGSSPMAAPLPIHRIRRRIESFEGSGRERPRASSCVHSL